jgi:hypothetical protein
MLSFEKDLDIFMNTDDFGIDVEIIKSGHTFTALFDFESEEDMMSQTRYPVLRARVRDVINAKMCEGDTIKVFSQDDPKGQADRLFKVRDIPAFTFDDEVIMLQLKDLNTDATRQPKYIP